MSIAVTFVGSQFMMDGSCVIYTVVGPDPFNTRMILSTEADIRAAMAVPAENWGNEDALVDCQNKVTAKYPAYDYLVVLPSTSE